MDLVLLAFFVISLFVFRKTLFRCLCELFKHCCHIAWSYLRSKSDIKERGNIDTGLDSGGKVNCKFEIVDDKKDPKIEIVECKKDPKIEIVECKKDLKIEIVECKKDLKIEIVECKKDPKIEIVECKKDLKIEIVECKRNHDIQSEEDREDIQIQNEGILYEIKRNLNKLEQLERNKKLVLENEESIARNENFTYTVEKEETKPVTFYVAPNTFAVTCQTCHTLCHRSCTILTNYGLYRCVAMDNQGDSAHAKCLKCPNHCSWKRHVTTRYVLSTELETSETSLITSYKSSADLLREFRGSDGKLMEVSGIIKLMDEECEANTLLIIGLIQVLRQNLTQLDGTAPTITGYIDILINSESSSDENGWEQRVEKLYKVRQLVNCLVEETKRGRSPVQLYRNKVKRRNIKIWSDVEHFLKIIAF